MLLGDGLQLFPQVAVFALQTARSPRLQSQAPDRVRRSPRSRCGSISAKTIIYSGPSRRSAAARRPTSPVRPWPRRAATNRRWCSTGAAVSCSAAAQHAVRRPSPARAIRKGSWSASQPQAPESGRYGWKNGRPHRRRHHDERRGEAIQDPPAGKRHRFRPMRLWICSPFHPCPRQPPEDLPCRQD